MRSMILVLALSVAAGARAQQTTSPRGYLTTSGDYTADLGMFIDSQGSQASQLLQLDDTQKGRPQTIRALHLRRSANVDDRASSTARTLEVRARMAHGDYSKIMPGLQQADSVLAGAWTVVVPSGTVNFPDMTARPTSSPAPWSVRVPLATPFAYDGKSAFYFQITAWQKSATSGFGYSLDGINENLRTSWGTPVNRGSGCKHRGNEMTVFADFVVYADNLPSEFLILTFPQVTAQAADTVAFVGLQNPALTVPGICVPLLVDPIVTVPMWQWAFDENGQAGWFEYVQFPHNASMLGLQLYVQTWAADALQTPSPVSGSSGWKSGSYPQKPVPKTAVAIAQTFGTNLGTFETMVGFQKNQGVIVGLEQ